MTMRILVSAASKHGATAEIADAIAGTLRDAGHEADLRPPAEVESVDGYDAVILGSAVYAGRWMDDARHFADRHRPGLLERPTWLFSSGPIGEPLAPTEEPVDGAKLGAARAARDHRVFPGRINPSDLSWVERTITRMVKAPDGDFRDWDAVREWATTIAGELVPEPATG